MKIKRLSALILAFALIFTMTSCKDDKNNDITEETTTQQNNVVYETTTENVSQDETTTVETTVVAETTTAVETTVAETTTMNPDDPSLWSKSKIVSFYKQACAASSDVTSSQVMSLADVVINDGGGAINSVFKVIRPIITKILQSSSTDFDGITGGHQNILDTDIKQARAYSSGDNIVVEMTMYEQVDGAKADRYSGTVGHAISVVGDISEVMQMLADAGIAGSVADEDVTLTYTNPTMKVLIGKDGKIINGTWSYTVDINLKNFTVRSTTVDRASAVIEYVITVNDGFNA